MRSLTLVLVFLLLAQSTFAEPIRIGVSLPLTGEAADYGNDAKSALEFAAQHYGNGKVQLLFEDDQCAGKGAVSAAHKFVSISKVQAVLGPVCSGALLAAGPVYERAGIPTFGIATSAPAISGLGRHIFRFAPNDSVSANILATHMQLSGLTLGIISEQTDYCEAFRQEFLSVLKKAEMPVADEIFTSGDSDLRTLLLRLRVAKVDGLFVNTQNEKGFLNVVRQVQRLGWKPRLFGAYWPSSSTVIKTLGSAADGIEFVDVKAPDQFLSAAGMDVYLTFKKLYGEPKSNPVVPPLAIEAFRTALAALESPDPINFLHKTTFDGIFGPFNLTEKGDLTAAPLGMNRIVSGKVEPIQGGT